MTGTTMTGGFMATVATVFLPIHGAAVAAGVLQRDIATLALPTTAFDERVLLDLAREHSVGRFMHDCIHARHAKDAATVLEEHVSDAERNALDFIACEDGRRMAVRGIFDNVAAASLRSAVLAFAAPTGHGDERPRSRRFADALVEIASRALDPGNGRQGDVPTSSSPPRWRR
ncbi:MAG: hypothetical protein WCB51_01995 [Candidatus Dormiibacterota bacterium]